MLELLPTDTEALDALARIYSGEADWRRWSGSSSSRCRWRESPTRAVELALQRAQIFDEKLHDTEDAAHALEQADRRADPAQLGGARAPARATTRRPTRLAARRQGRRAAAVPDRGPGASARRARWSWRAGRDRLRDDKKATRRLRARAGDGRRTTWTRCARWRRSTQDRRSTSAADLTPTRSCWSRPRIRTARRPLILQIARLYEKQLGEPRAAFEWYRRAYNESPDAEALQAGRPASPSGTACSRS